LRNAPRGGTRRQGAETCYFCGDSKTSIEHAPARVFFPEQKDLAPGSPHFRRDPITVPSCDTHNGRASKDDEVAAYLVAMCFGINQIGRNHFTTKVTRALQHSVRRDGSLRGALLKGPAQPIVIDGEETGYGPVNTAALYRVAERIARAVYFHEHRERWTAELLLKTDMLRDDDGRVAPDWEFVQQMKASFAVAERRGASPEVFFYQWSPAYGALRLCFYEGPSIYVIECPTEGP
jgi:hypothetical protein